MPYKPSHKKMVRAKIIESARILFNRHGFESVTIDMVMELSGLTRGGFYNHFKSKDQLYSEAISSFPHNRGHQWREENNIDVSNPSIDITKQMLKSYLSSDNLKDVDGQCPMIALPSDLGRAGPEVQNAYQKLLEAMVWLLETGLKEHKEEAREKALSLAALSIGGMVLAKALPDSELAKKIQSSACKKAIEMIESK